MPGGMLFSATCEALPFQTRGEKCGLDVRLSGLQAYQREEPERVLCRKAPDGRQAPAEEVVGNQAATPAASARPGDANGRVAPAKSRMR